MDRRHYDADHFAFAEAYRGYLDKHVIPHYLEWEKTGIAPREIFAEAGRGGFLGMQVPEQYGGGGTSDFRFNQILSEEGANAGITGVSLGITLHNDTCLPYFLKYGNEEQKARWLPGIADGTLITAIAMTEPGAGSDLAGIRTSARRDGADYIVNGSKTFITNGINADLVITVVRTSEDRKNGLSLLIIERGMPGFARGRNLEKIGLHSQDTAELIFTDVRVPAANLLGNEGDGFGQLTNALPQERTAVAINGVNEARAAFHETVQYVKDRKAFGTSIANFQNTKFVLAEIATEIDITQAWVDLCVQRLNDGTLTTADASKAKYWATDLQGRVIDRCLQLFGGYGYMTEYPIARRYADARVTRIYAGSNEIMKSVISKSIGL